MSKLVNVHNAAQAIGPYSHAAYANNVLYTSGQIPVVPATGEIIAGGIEEQAKQSLENVKIILEHEGMSMQDVVKTLVFLTDLADFAVVNQIYEQAFAPNKPARSCVQVAALPKGAKIEIEAIACK